MHLGKKQIYFAIVCRKLASFVKVSVPSVYDVCLKLDTMRRL